MVCGLLCVVWGVVRNVGCCMVCGLLYDVLSVVQYVG
jgi:hypothetical protein